MSDMVCKYGAHFSPNPEHLLTVLGGGKGKDECPTCKGKVIGDKSHDWWLEALRAVQEKDLPLIEAMLKKFSGI